jgi:predicted metal-dependent hydrolase
MKKRHIRHRVEVTRNKHSRAVCKGDTIIIRLARNLSKTERQEHISSLLRRMTRLILEERQKTVISPFNHLLNGGQTQTVEIATGKKYIFSMMPGERTRARRTARGWNIEVSPQVRRTSLHQLLWRAIAASELPRIRQLVQTINDATYGVPVKQVKLQFATTQWGSCSPKGVIMINAALLFLPPRLLKYVIIHELAHRIHANHSDTYWKTVERSMPGYETAYHQLHQYRLPQL